MRSNLTKLAAVAALAAGMSFGQEATPTPQPAPGRPAARLRAGVRQRMMQALNLTDAQKQQAKSIFQQSRQSVQPVVAQLKQNREALTAAVKANDTAKIQQLTATQGQLQGQMMAARAQAMAKFYQTLTPEQRTKAEQMRQTAKSRVARHNG